MEVRQEVIEQYISDIAKLEKQVAELEGSLRYSKKERIALLSLIQCPSCKGAGFGLGESLGVSECPECGGDGHIIEDRQCENLNDIIEQALALPAPAEVCESNNIFKDLKDAIEFLTTTAGISKQDIIEALEHIETLAQQGQKIETESY